MTIRYNGNVGIGYDQPSTKLAVNGTFSVSGVSTFSEKVKLLDKVTIGSNIAAPTKYNENGNEYQLFVAGGIFSQEVSVNLSVGSFPDFVFGEDYPLLPLETIENYIKTNGHLPNVPSAQEIENSGMELKAMTLNQQARIEELFLYVLQLNKEIETLKTENIALKEKSKQK